METTTNELSLIIPAWINERDIKILEEKQDYIWQLDDHVKDRMRMPENITISDWAMRYRVVTGIDSQAGAWRQEKVPHTKLIMDTIGKPYTREVWMCMVERSGKTQILINTMLWMVDQGMKSGNVFWLMPTEMDARTALGERIIPVLQASPKMQKHISAKADDMTRGMIRFKNGIRLKPAWSNSPSSLASFFGRLNIADETDKYAERTSEGTDPITLFLKRSRDDRHGSKYIFASTPGQRYIYKGMQGCQQIYEYHARCPDCNELIVMTGDNFILPEETTLENVHIQTILYACDKCGCLWDETSREKAYLQGKWVCVKGTELHKPATVGFHFTGFPCPMVTFAEIAMARLKRDTGGLIEKTAWANGYEAIDFLSDTSETRSVKGVMKYKSEYPTSMVPSDTYCLGIAIDTQIDSFRYQVWAFGYAPTYSMSMIQHGRLEKFADIEQLMKKEFSDIGGNIFRIVTGFIDSGGTTKTGAKHSRTMEVYEWCMWNRSVMPIKGMHGRQGELISYKDVPVLAGGRHQISGLLKRANIRVSLFKDDLERRLTLEPDDAGSLSFHNGIDDMFAKQYTTEVKNEAGEWKLPKGKKNDHWDCTVYALALSQTLKPHIPVKLIKQPEQKKRLKTIDMQTTQHERRRQQETFRRW